MRSFLAFMMVLFVIRANANVGNVVSSASATMTLMDTTVATNDVMTIRGQMVLPIAYSSSLWCADLLECKLLSISAAGEEVLLESEGEGVFRWPLTKGGTYVLVHRVDDFELRKRINVVTPEVKIERLGVYYCKLTPSDGESPIRYTLDGSEPTEDSALYTGPFALPLLDLSFVRACTFGDGYPQGVTASGVFEKSGYSVSSSASMLFMDTRAGKGALAADGVTDVSWSGLWEGDNAAEVVVEEDGKTILRGMGEGMCLYYPSSVGSHILTHTTYKGGRAVGDPLTATLELSTTLKRGLVSNGEAIIPEGTMEIGEGAFAGRTDLTSVMIPSSVSNVAATAFAGCANIEAVALDCVNSMVERNMPGLWQARFNAYKDWSSSILDSETCTRVSGVVMGYTRTSSSGTIVTDPIFGGSYNWNSSYTTFGYRGYMFMNAGRRYVFGKDFDDAVYLEIDGIVVMDNAVYNQFTTGTYDATWTGWHEIEVRLADETSTKGPRCVTWSSTMGLGWRDDGETAALPESGWDRLMDPGDGSLFRIEPYVTCRIAELFPDSYEGIKSVTILEGADKINSDFCAGCAALETVAIPSGVEFIGRDAFLGCENLKRVDVESLDAWLGITFANDAANPLSTGAKLYVGGEELKELVIPDGVTEIGEYEFQEGSFTSVSIPNSVTDIAPTAFAGCENVEDIVLPFDFQSRTPGFYETEFSIMSSYSDDNDIKENARAVVLSADKLTTKTSATQTMYGYATYMWFEGGVRYEFLAGYDDRSSIKVDGKWIVQVASSDCKVQTGAVEFERDGWRWIEVRGWNNGGNGGASGYNDCSGIKWRRSGEDWRLFADAGDGALFCVKYSTTLQDILPDSYLGVKRVSLVGEGGAVSDDFFKGCASLESVIIPDTVNSIGVRAFEGCVALETMTIPSSVSFFGEDAFKGCENLKRVDVATMEDWLNISFANADANPLSTGAKLYVGGEELKELVIPDGVTEIGEYEFQGGSFTSVSIPNSVTNIAPTAFAGCTNIVEASLGCPASSADLVHRWSFNGDLMDAVGGQTAKIVGNVTSDGQQCILAGGSGGKSYIDLGSNILPNDGSGVTLEIWGTQKSVKKCSRIWDIGGGTATDMLMAWTRNSDVNEDGICIRQIGDDITAKLSPYTIGTEFHIATVFNPQADGTWKVNYYKQDASSGTTLAKTVIDTSGSSWSLTKQDQADCWLGHSHWSGDYDANASYNEVRVWRDTLTEDELSENARHGPNKLRSGCTLRRVFPDAYSKIGKVTVVDGVARLPGGMFEGCVELEFVTLPDNLETIGEGSFCGCSAITELRIPSSVMKIGEDAFLGCECLNRVDVTTLEDWMSISFANAAANPLSTGAKLYVGGEELKELVIPDGVTEIGEYEFQGGSFTSVSIPNSVTNIAPTAFAGCSNIVSAEFGTWPEMLHECKPEMAGWSAAGDGVYQTERQTQYNQTLVLKTEVEGPRCASFRWKATYSGNYFECYVDGVQQSLLRYSSADWQEVQIDVPAGRHTIEWEYYNSSNYGDYYGWVDLSGWTYYAPAEVSCLFPDSYANIQQVSIRDGVTKIGADAFFGCENLKRVDAVSLNDWLGIEFANGAANPLSTGAKLYVGGEELKELVIPDGVTEIGEYEFQGGSFTLVTIPSSVTNIAPTAFAGCANLSNVVLNGGVPVSRQKGPEVVEGTMWIEETETLGDDKVYRSNPIGFNQSTAIEFAIPKGLEQVVFSWKVGSEQNYDWLTWYLDGVQQGRISGSRDWESIAKDLDGEGHVLKFSYSEDNVISVAPDCGWVSVHASGGGAPTLIGLFPDSPIAVVTIGDEIAEVPESFFANCTAMETVVLSGAVTNIGVDAFLGCENLKRVEVVSLEDWLKIELANETANPLYYGAELYAGGVKVQGYSRLLLPIVYENLCGATHTNPASYQEGIPVVFTPPNGRTGYAFTGWTPEEITAEMSGGQTATAGWRANTYKIEYDANGGIGTMAATDCEYDKEQVLASNQFVRAGYVFVGWAVAEDGDSTIEDGAIVKNLTSADGAVVRLYAVWEVEHIETPVIMPGDGTVFKGKSCTVTIACATERAVVYYTTDGTTPRPKPAFQYNGPFEITDTATIVAMAFKDGNQSDYAEVTITHVDPEELTLVSALGEPKLYDVATGGDGEWVPIVDGAGKTMKTSALSGVLEEDDEGTVQVSWLEAKVYGKGTLTFWWRTSCEPDPRGMYTYDYAEFKADGIAVAHLDGVTDGWVPVSVAFDTVGEHVLRWSYNVDGWLSMEGEFEDCAWVNGVVWTPSAAPVIGPTIEGDAGATVTGDAETGFVVKPSEGKTAVEVTIPQGVDAAKVTVEVSPKVASVKPNGAKVKIVSGGADITEFLNVPTADGNGVVDLTKATVKEEIVKEVMDGEKGAKIVLDAADPKLTTAPTRVGLFYLLREGETLDGMKDGDSTVGNGEPWLPEITVKGGNSAFYSIGVGKGE